MLTLNLLVVHEHRYHNNGRNVYLFLFKRHAEVGEESPSVRGSETSWSVTLQKLGTWPFSRRHLALLSLIFCVTWLELGQVPTLISIPTHPFISLIWFWLSEFEGLSSYVCLCTALNYFYFGLRFGIRSGWKLPWSVSLLLLYCGFLLVINSYVVPVFIVLGVGSR